MWPETPTLICILSAHSSLLMSAKKEALCFSAELCAADSTSHCEPLVSQKQEEMIFPDRNFFFPKITYRS